MRDWPMRAEKPARPPADLGRVASTGPAAEGRMRGQRQLAHIQVRIVAEGIEERLGRRIQHMTIY